MMKNPTSKKSVHHYVTEKRHQNNERNVSILLLQIKISGYASTWSIGI